MLLHFPDNRFTDSGEVVSLALRPSFTPKQDFWNSFLLETESIPGPTTAGWVRKTLKFNGLMRNRTRDLPAYSVVPQPTALPKSSNQTVLNLYSVLWLPP
jgi:hypothetical protein